MRIASFTQTYGDHRFLELQLLQHDRIGNAFRNQCDLILFSFHNCPEAFLKKSVDLLKTIYPSSKLKILIYNKVPYLQCIRSTIQYLKQNRYDYMLQIQDDQHGINTQENLNAIENVQDLFTSLRTHQLDYLHVFSNEGNKTHNKLTPLQEMTCGNTEFYCYDSRDFKRANIYAWNDGTYFAKIEFLEHLFNRQLPEDVWRIELTLKATLERNCVLRWGINKLYFKASNLHGRNVNRAMSVEENLKRFFGELPEWPTILTYL